MVGQRPSARRLFEDNAKALVGGRCYPIVAPQSLNVGKGNAYPYITYRVGGFVGISSVIVEKVFEGIDLTSINLNYFIHQDFDIRQEEQADTAAYSKPYHDVNDLNLLLLRRLETTNRYIGLVSISEGFGSEFGSEAAIVVSTIVTIKE